MRLADVAARDREPRLLDQRVAAVVEGDRVNDAGLVRGVEQLLRLRRGHRQRLVGDDVLAFGDGRGIDRIVQVVGRGVVHDLDVRIVEQRLVAPVGLRGAERLRLGPGRCLAASRDRDNVDETQPPDRIHVMGTDKSGAHDSHADSLHTCLHSAPWRAGYCNARRGARRARPSIPNSQLPTPTTAVPTLDALRRGFKQEQLVATQADFRSLAEALNVSARRLEVGS